MDAEELRNQIEQYIRDKGIRFSHHLHRPGDPLGLYRQSKHKDGSGKITFTIFVYRKNHCDQIDDHLIEAFTIAHEFGHHQSFLNKYRTQHYQSLIEEHYDRWKLFNSDQKQMIMDEEKRAWSYARQILEHFGFSDWSALDQHKNESLSIYRKMLSMTEEIN